MASDTPRKVCQKLVTHSCKQHTYLHLLNEPWLPMCLCAKLHSQVSRQQHTIVGVCLESKGVWRSSQNVAADSIHLLGIVRRVLTCAASTSFTEPTCPPSTCHLPSVINEETPQIITAKLLRQILTVIQKHIYRQHIPALDFSRLANDAAVTWQRAVPALKQSQYSFKHRDFLQLQCLAPG